MPTPPGEDRDHNSSDSVLGAHSAPTSSSAYLVLPHLIPPPKGQRFQESHFTDKKTEAILLLITNQGFVPASNTSVLISKPCLTPWFIEGVGPGTGTLRLSQCTASLQGLPSQRPLD